MLCDVCQKKSTARRFLDLVAKLLRKSDACRQLFIFVLNHAERECELRDEIMIPKSAIVLDSYLNLASCLSTLRYRQEKIHLGGYV